MVFHVHLMGALIMGRLVRVEMRVFEIKCNVDLEHVYVTS
jgi:hypothetical protein